VAGGVRRALRLYPRLVVANLRTAAGQRGDAVTQIIATALGQVGGLVVLWSLLARTAGVEGVDTRLAMLVLGLVTLSLGVSQLALDGVWNLRFMVADGSLDYALLRPRSVLLQVVFSRAGLHGAGSVVVGAALVGIALAGPAEGRPEVSLLGGLVATVAGIVLRTMLYVAANSIAFWGHTSVALPMAVHQVTEFGQCPLPMYGPTARVVLSTAVPVASSGSSLLPSCSTVSRGPHSPRWDCCASSCSAGGRCCSSHAGYVDTGSDSARTAREQTAVSRGSASSSAGRPTSAPTPSATCSTVRSGTRSE
jgi:ABC-2 type transport system permease protein